jgi:hypothetical protein
MSANKAFQDIMQDVERRMDQAGNEMEKVLDKPNHITYDPSKKQLNVNARLAQYTEKRLEYLLPYIRDAFNR